MRWNRLIGERPCPTVGLCVDSAVRISDVVALHDALHPTNDGCHAGRNDVDVYALRSGAWMSKIQWEDCRQAFLVFSWSKSDHL